MQLRKITTRVLFAVAIPFVFLGLIDPLEGGLALALALLIYIPAFVISKQKPIRLLWIPFCVALVIGSSTLGLAIANLEFSQQPEGLPGPIIFGLWGYRLAVAVTLAGSVLTLIRSFRSTNN